MSIRKDFKNFNDKTIAIFDTSYFFHNKLNATYNYYLRQYGAELFHDKTQIGKYDFSTDADFVNCLEFFCKKDTEAYLTEHGSNWQHLIWAMDCSKKNIWRRDYYPLYKENRIQKQDEGELDYTTPNFGTMWKHIYNNFLPKLISEKQCYMSRHDACEGDDIIAIIKELVCEQLPDKKIIINAYDSDLAQLITSDNIKIINLEGTNVGENNLKK